MQRSLCIFEKKFLLIVTFYLQLQVLPISFKMFRNIFADVLAHADVFERRDVYRKTRKISRTRPVERRIGGGVSYPVPATLGGPPSHKNIMYIIMRHFDAQN